MLLWLLGYTVTLVLKKISYNTCHNGPPRNVSPNSFVDGMCSLLLFNSLAFLALRFLLHSSLYLLSCTKLSPTAVKALAVHLKFQPF